MFPKEQQTAWLPWIQVFNLASDQESFFSLEYHRNAMGKEEPKQYPEYMLHPIYEHYPVTLKGQDYLMTSLQYQITLLWSIGLTLLHNENDGSSLFLLELDWNLAEDLWLNGSGSFSSSETDPE